MYFSSLACSFFLAVTVYHSDKRNKFSIIQPVSGIIDTEVVGNSWINKTNTPQGGAIRGIAAVNGKIYAFGVYQYNETSYATTAEYDPSTDTWTTKSPMRQPRTNFATTITKQNLPHRGTKRCELFARSWNC
jgi:hypothetical protein